MLEHNLYYQVILILPLRFYDCRQLLQLLADAADRALLPPSELLRARCGVVRRRHVAGTRRLREDVPGSADTVPEDAYRPETPPGDARRADLRPHLLARAPD